MCLCMCTHAFVYRAHCKSPGHTTAIANHCRRAQSFCARFSHGSIALAVALINSDKCMCVCEGMRTCVYAFMNTDVDASMEHHAHCAPARIMLPKKKSGTRPRLACSHTSNRRHATGVV